MLLIRTLKSITVACVLLINTSAWAQRADENVVDAAQDAFGTTVGSESIGLYNSGSARGFNPRQAGNIRIEGLYFHGPVAGGGIELSNRLFGQSTVRVGLTAQSYPFPSPTGIADYSLRIPGDDYALSAVLKLGPYDATGVELDAQIPIFSDTFSLGVGLGVEREVFDHRSSRYKFSGAVIGRWRIGQNVEVIPFWSQARTDDDEFGPWIFTGGLYAPPKIKRSIRRVPEWSEINKRDSTFGAIARGTWSDWQVKMGLFRSIAAKPKTRLTMYFDVQPDGAANLQFWKFPNELFPSESTSGEFRVSRIIAEGPRRHTLSLNARGRSAIQGSGGVDRVDAGTTVLGERLPDGIPDPDFQTLPRNKEHVHEGSIGLNYEAQWRGVGEFSAGLQRVFYERTTTLPITKASNSTWLYNTTLAAYLTERLALYASYTRGLEDSPNAPAVSTNEGEGVPASTTSQIDGGFRYSFGPSLRLVAGVFQVKKPFFSTDDSNTYRQLGNISHKGVELSLTGEPIEGLRIVGGLVLLKARVSGDFVEQGVIGKIPTGSEPVTVNMNVQYGAESWGGFSVDGRVSHASSYYANIENTFKVKANTTLDLGVRYRFDLYGTPAQLRAQVTNVLNSYVWLASGNERLWRPTSPRKGTLQLTVDF